MNKSTITIAPMMLLEPVFINTQSTSAITKVGVSMYNACKYQYPAAHHWEVFIKPGQYNVHGWACHLNYIQSGSVQLNVDQECRRAYGSKATAGYDDYNNPYSWYCAY